MKLKTIYCGLDSIENECSIDNVKFANIVIHLQDPVTSEVLQKPVYEIYYDYNDNDEEYESSFVTELYTEVLELIEELEMNTLGLAQ